MAKLSEDEIAEGLGLPKPEKKAAATATGRALQDVATLDGRLQKMAEGQRQQGETSAAAMSRLLRENPNLATSYDQERSAILKRHGVGDVAGIPGGAS